MIISSLTQYLKNHLRPKQLLTSFLILLHWLSTTTTYMLLSCLALKLTFKPRGVTTQPSALNHLHTMHHSSHHLANMAISLMNSFQVN